MRTEATLAALHRDMWLCQYHMHRLHVAMNATDGHHMFGRSVDVPEAIIALCRPCHIKLHDGQLDRHDVIKIQVDRGILTDDKVSRYESAKICGTKGSGGS